LHHFWRLGNKLAVRASYTPVCWLFAVIVGRFCLGNNRFRRSHFLNGRRFWRDTANLSHCSPNVVFHVAHSLAST
jgi:hypothetical protein